MNNNYTKFVKKEAECFKSEIGWMIFQLRVRYNNPVKDRLERKKIRKQLVAFLKENK